MDPSAEVSIGKNGAGPQQPQLWVSTMAARAVGVLSFYFSTMGKIMTKGIPLGPRSSMHACSLQQWLQCSVSR